MYTERIIIISVFFILFISKCVICMYGPMKQLCLK